jgi:hypothetical protein
MNIRVRFPPPPPKNLAFKNKALSQGALFIHCSIDSILKKNRVMPNLFRHLFFYIGVISLHRFYISFTFFTFCNAFCRSFGSSKGGDIGYLIFDR